MWPRTRADDRDGDDGFGGGGRNSSTRALVVACAAGLFFACVALLTSLQPSFVVGSRGGLCINLSNPPPLQSNPSSTSDKADDPENEDDGNPKNDHTKWWFQADLTDYAVPKYDVEKLSKYPAHRYKGPGHPVYSTFYASRNATLQDPYFIASQQFIYRLLWDPQRKSVKHPVVVFVASFVSEEQRKYFRAAGALVRELDTRAYHPKGGMPDRYRDMFTKLEIYRHVDFSDMFYLDSDAVVERNPDPIFDLVPEQHCVKKRLPEEDAAAIAGICTYRFAAWPEAVGGQLNAGVMLLRPNLDMYARIIRSFFDGAGTKWNDATFEQGLLDHNYRAKGPFPAKKLGDEWNGGHKQNDTFYIHHAKLWSLTFGEVAWIGEGYRKVWDELVAFYESPEFEKLRKQDRDLAFKAA